MSDELPDWIQPGNIIRVEDYYTVLVVDNDWDGNDPPFTFISLTGNGNADTYKEGMYPTVLKFNMDQIRNSRLLVETNKCLYILQDLAHKAARTRR